MKRLFALLFLLAFMSLALFAYQFSPLNVTFEPSGGGSAKVYTIVNDSDSAIAIEVSAVKRSITIDGEEYNEDASQYFTIQPSKMIINPQSTQLVRVQYRGPRTVTEELSFRIISEQIPYSTGAKSEGEGQMISFLFVYSTSAYVQPGKIVEKVETTASINVEGKLEIVFTNKGSVHQLLNDLSVTIKGNNGSTYTLTDEDMGAIKGSNLLCGASLRIVMDVPSALSGAKSFTPEIKYNYSWSN